LFVKHFNLEIVTIFLVCVDDIIVTDNDEQEQQRLSQCLAENFKLRPWRD